MYSGPRSSHLDSDPPPLSMSSWTKFRLHRAQYNLLLRLGLTAVGCFILGFWSNSSGGHGVPVNDGMQLLTTSLSRPTLSLSGLPHAAEKEAMNLTAFNEIAVQKLGDSLVVLVPNEESLYADGNRAQEALYKRIYQDACGKSGNLVVDVGGLLSDFSLYAGGAGCRAVCFEPQRPYYDLARASILLNGLEGAVEVVHAAVGPNHDAKLYYVRGDHAGGNSFAPKPVPGVTSEEVPSYRLDNVLQGESILLIKIDVEGFDVGAVRSAEGLLRANLVKHLIFEYSPWLNGEGQGGWVEVLDWLHSLPSPPRLYALHRTGTQCYGPLDPTASAFFANNHLERHLMTDIYATWDKDFDPQCSGPWTPEVWARRRHAI